MSRIAPILTSCLAAGMLAACGGPSSSDVEATLRSEFGKQGVVVHSVRTIGCVAAQGENGYNCDVEVDSTVKFPFIGPKRQVKAAKIRLVEDNGHWSIAG